MSGETRPNDLRNALLAIVVSLAGCSHALTEGEVDGKGHEAEQTVMIMMPMTSCSGGKSNICTTTIIPLFFYYPERWYVHIRAYKDGEWKADTWWVPEPLYEQVVVGGYFKADSQCTNREPRSRVEKNT